jgi:hypothetical protein
MKLRTVAQALRGKDIPFWLTDSWKRTLPWDFSGLVFEQLAEDWVTVGRLCGGVSAIIAWLTSLLFLAWLWGEVADTWKIRSLFLMAVPTPGLLYLLRWCHSGRYLRQFRFDLEILMKCAGVDLAGLKHLTLEQVTSICGPSQISDCATDLQITTDKVREILGHFGIRPLWIWTHDPAMAAPN